jgi:hypothetical protein
METGQDVVISVLGFRSTFTAGLQADKGMGGDAAGSGLFLASLFSGLYNAMRIFLHFRNFWVDFGNSRTKNVNAPCNSCRDNHAKQLHILAALATPAESAHGII